MLNWIVGNKVDHPLADVKEARALIAALPTSDSVKTLEEVTHWLESLAHTEGFKLDRLFEIIDLLDTAAKSPHRKLLQDYLGMRRQQKAQENRLWSCGFKFAKALGDLYLAWVRQQESAGIANVTSRKHTPVVVARAIRSIALQVKWNMLRYGPFEPRLWAAIGELYRCAEKGGFVDTPLTIYPGVHGTGTVKREYLKIMMLWASSADVLSPLQQDVSERTVAFLADSFRLEKEPFEGALYGFDPSRDKRPLRLYGAPVTGKNLYYFSPGDAAARLQEIMPGLERTGALPADVILGGTYPAEVVLTVFRHLCLYWSEKPPARTSERRATTARMTVVPGYFQLVEELERDDVDALDFNASRAESWVVENVSENGYGALLPAAASEWVRVGELIGVQVEGSSLWGVAIVRRVSRDEHRQYHVGIEVLSRAVHVVRVAHGPKRASEVAVLLSSSPDRNNEVGLIVRSGRYLPGHAGEMIIKGARYGIAPSRMVDAGEDFDWAMYKVSRAA